MKCSRCGRENTEEARLCAGCGTRLESRRASTGGSSSATQLPTHFQSGSGRIGETVGLPEEDEGRTAAESGGTLGLPEDDRDSVAGEVVQGTMQLPPTGGSSSGTGGAAPVRHGPLPPGTILASRYEILDLLGEGGMGEVYRAQDRELGKVIALKTVRSDKGADGEALARFKQELLLAREITHRNVIRIHDLGEADGLRFITMELIEGEDLKDLIDRRGALPHTEAVPIAVQILEALEAAHEQGVVHRDLKPQNIMLDQRGVPRIMDFGIARSVERTGMTATGSVLGTPDYMSPEQASGQKADPRSDLFSFGIILYEMLTGDLPYKADSPISRVMMRLTHKPRPPRELNVEIPDFLEAVVLKCMERDPELRYQSAAEVLQDLRQEQFSRSLTSYTLRAQRAVARRKGILALAAVAVVAVVAALYFALSGPLSAPEETAAPEQVVVEGPVSYLAVLPFTNATGSESFDWMRTGLPEMLVTDLSQSRFLRPIPSERVLTAMQGLGMAEQTRFDEAALDELSEQVAAESVLYGQFVESGGELRLDLTLRRAQSGVPLSLKVAGRSDEVFDLVDEITRQVKENLDLTPEQLKGDTDRPISEVSTASLAALRDYQSGLRALRAGSGQEAIELLESATTQDEDFAMAHAKLAEAYLHAGRDPEAEVAIERAEELAEEEVLPLAERYQIHAMAARARHDLETAAESYSQLAALYPTDPDLLFSLAATYEEMGKFHEAADAYGRLLEIAPDSAEGRFGLAWARLGSGEPDACITMLEEDERSGRYDGNPQAQGMLHSILGVAYREKSDPVRSLDHLEKSLAYRKEAGDLRGQAITLGNISQIYEHLGELDQAIEGQRQALELIRQLGDRESESDLLFEIGRTYSGAGRLDDALRSLRASMEIEMERQDHANLAIRMNSIANVYRQKGEYQNALTWLQQARSHGEQAGMKSSLAVTDTFVGLIKKTQGLYDQALEALLPALSAAQELEEHMLTGDIHRVLGEIYTDQGRYNDAYEALTKSLEIYTHIHAGHDIAELKPSFARLLIALGQVEAAEEQLDEAEAMTHHEGPGESLPEVLLGRAELAELRGATEEAAKLYREANVAANQSQIWEVAVRSRIALGHLYLTEELRDPQSAGGNPVGILEKALEQAEESRLRPLQAAAHAGLAEVYLRRGDPSAAVEQAALAVDLAKRLEARPTLYRAYAMRGQALEMRGDQEGALEAYAETAEILEWIRGSMKPEHVATFMTRPDVQEILTVTVGALERSGDGRFSPQLESWLDGGATGP